MLYLAACHHANHPESNPSIFGGREVEAPAYIAGIVAPLTSDTAQLCGGTLVSPHVVITAAHCAGPIKEGVYVVLASKDIGPIEMPYTGPERAQIVTVKSVTVYPGYMDSGSQLPPHDIAYIILNAYDQKDWPNRAVPVGINRDSAQPERTGHASLFGWGQTETDAAAKILRSVEVPLVDQGTCRGIYSGRATIGDNHLCSGNLSEGKVDSCHGDSGGPLIYTDSKGQPVLAGVISWGAGCASRGQPGVNTRVSYYADWIDAAIKAYN